MGSKLSAELETSLRGADASSLMEVVVEVRPTIGTTAPSAAASRSERIAAMKAEAEQCFAPVESAISRIGGVVTGHTWLNKTLRARLPVQAVRELSEREEVAAVDVPHALEPENA